MSKKSPQLGEGFIEQRLRSLATIYLTRRDDLTITEAAKEDLVDLLVAIQAKEKGNRTFGVILQGTRADLPTDQANAVLRPKVEALSVHAFSYPVCLFFFRMANDRGYFTWIAEPWITREGHPVLRHPNEPACIELDTEVIHTLVQAVNAWYDAFQKSVVECSKLGRKVSGVEVLHSIIDGEAHYYSEHGQPPKLLKLPTLQAYELAKLGREHLGDLAGRIIQEGVRVLEKEGLLGMKVKLVKDQPDFSLE